ncbi:hypothetical protein GCM10007854_14460 [Algimonas porphyrae]|uniref:Uncharacterized protein n=1 Tax=Algimonas porphyrae TaxID=1128113 RepID=A0ABQ5UZ70_9PROT|nr:hypothetical protein GCM10007854_14460 [Algimonas porphyrae]
MILCASAGGRLGINEDIVLDTINRSGLPVTRSEMRDAAHYVESHGYIGIDEGDNQWVFKITSKGTDLVDNEIACPKSIARPPKYWGD